MDIRDFKLERYFARWEFTTAQNLCASDPTPVTMRQLLEMADAESTEWWNNLSLGYTETAGHPLLRSEIAKQYSTASAADIIVVSGAQEAIFLALNGILKSGDEVVVITPAYQSLYDVPQSLGAQVIPILLRESTGWELDLDIVMSAIGDRTRALVINYPNNPTGAHISRETFTTLCTECCRRGIYLISDEVYRGLEYDPSERLPAAVDVFPMALSIGVMTKTFGLAGLRIGWIATKNQSALREIARLRDYTTICSSAPSEVLAVIGLRNAAFLRARALDIIQANRGLWQSFFNRNSDLLSWVPPRAGSVGFGRLATGDAEQLAAELVRDVGVLLLPGTVFDMPASYFRVGMGRRGIKEAVDTFEYFLRAKSYKRAWTSSIS